MFRMDKETKEKLERGLPNKRERAKLNRQSVYEAIAEDPFISGNKELAEKVGYDMDDCHSDSYRKGMNFINRLLRGGYIEKQIGRDGKEYFYNSSKEYDNATVTKEEPESLKEARENFAKELADYEPLPEEPTKETFFTGCISIGQKDSESKIVIDFADKTKSEIIEIINNLNLEDIF